MDSLRSGKKTRQRFLTLLVFVVGATTLLVLNDEKDPGRAITKGEAVQAGAAPVYGAGEDSVETGTHLDKENKAVLDPPDPHPAETQPVIAPTVSLQQPTQQQQEAQTLLEQKVNGDIQVMGALLPEILGSEEFALLNKQQKYAVAQRIVDRLNNGELDPKDVYP